jgi:aminoglycoside phosphotransferase (APT) family kinase protein
VQALHRELSHLPSPRRELQRNRRLRTQDDRVAQHEHARIQRWGHRPASLGDCSDGRAERDDTDEEEQSPAESDDAGDATLRALSGNTELPGIDRARVDAWLTDHLGDAAPPFEYSLVAAGGSNLTFRVTDAAGSAWALRRPPVTAVLATAHDMDREWRLLEALSRDGSVPVPAPVARCDDVGVTDGPFYVMDFVDGTILRTERDGAALAPPDAERATASLVEVQVALHALDPLAVGLGDLGRPGSYVERQLHRWKTQVERAKVRELPLLDDLHQRLARSVPPPADVALAHGDYRFDNTVLGPDHRIRAVLDWELCTTGDAVADFAWSWLYWADPGDPCPFLASSPTLAPGFERRDAVAERYAVASGRDLSSLGWFTVFGYWKMACIVEGVHARRLRGASGGGGRGDPATIAARADALLEHADDAARGVLSARLAP